VENGWTSQAESEDNSAEPGSLINWAGMDEAKGWAAGDASQSEPESWPESHGLGDAEAGKDRNWAEAGDVRSGENGADPDAALREAMRAHFPSSAERARFPSSSPDEELAQKLETHFRSAAVPAADERTPPSGAGGVWGRKRIPGVDEEMVPDPVEEPAESGEGDAAFDQRLYREIEETQEKSGEARRRTGRGGLALAAAWGLFLCVAGGLVVGFFAFRDIIAGALPGLAPLYRASGLPVTVQPLIFEAVEYKWTVSENKPVLVVSGSVYNRAQRKVRVPQFFITIKDQDPALDREYPADLRINGSKIKSDQRAGFDIELLSPDPTVTSVELELRNVR
jgi:hypothetical protein